MPPLFNAAGVTAHLLQGSTSAELADFGVRVRDYVTRYYGLDGAGMSGEAVCAWLLGAGPGGNRRLIGLRDAERTLIGVMVVVADFSLPDEWLIELCLLVPQARRRGIGSALWRAFERWAATQGVRSLLVAVVVENQAGKAYWARQGFERVRGPQRLCLGQRVHEAVLLIRCLCAARRSDLAAYLADPGPASPGLRGPEARPFNHPRFRLAAGQ